MLYFTIRMASKVNIIYQFSLPWFLNILQLALQRSKRSDQVEQRVEYIKKQLLAMTFERIMRSMFEKDKLLFSFLLAIKSQLFYGQIEKWTFNLLAQRWNMIEVSQNKENVSIQSQNPCSSWLNDQKWMRLRYLEVKCSDKQANHMSKLLQNFEQNTSQWEILYRKGILKENMQMMFQEDWPRLHQNSDDISKVERLLIIKAIAPNKLKSGVRVYVQRQMGSQFIEPPTFDLEASYQGSASSIPLIFVLPGNQPLGPISSFAKIKKKYDTLKKISLGKGTGLRAQKAIEDAKRNGQWVLLQNCHLVPSWMPTLEKIVESFQGKSPNRQGSSITQLRQSPDKGGKRDSIQSLSGKQSQIHPSFRLWLTTYSSDCFPQLVLQNGIKIVNEPPIGLKANLISSYTISDSINDPVKFQLHPYPLFWKRLLFSLCSFHALIQERTKYGSLGWNEVYQFTHSDLQISILQLSKQLQNMPQLEFELIPWKALHYLTGQCNYGGRITDEHDRKLLNSLLKDMYSSNSLQKNAKIRGLKQYPFPGDEMGYAKTMQFICNIFPITQPAELFGFSSNADIVKDISQGKAMCDTLFQLRQDINSSSLINRQFQDKFSGQDKLPQNDIEEQKQLQEQNSQDQQHIQGDKGLNVIKEQFNQQSYSKRRILLIETSNTQSKDNIEQNDQVIENEKTLKLVKDIEQKIRTCRFDLQTLSVTHPIQYEDSINTILHHQAERYNSLLKVIRDTLERVQRVIMGQIQMTPETQEIKNELNQNKTPRAWLKRSYPSIKPLGSYISDLKQRLEMFKFWIENGKPDLYWFSGFFFPQSFLTALLQGYTRSRKCPIDELEFSFDFQAASHEIIKQNDGSKNMYAKKRERVSQGETRIFGLYLEGASWNGMYRQMEEAAPEILYVRMPIIDITVCKKKKSLQGEGLYMNQDEKYERIMPMSYECPVYLTQQRKKKIATYSYSQNHVINITIPATKPGDHWLKRGAALVCQISD